MNVKELIAKLQKLPQDKEVKYAVNKGRGKRTLCAINDIEIYENAWVILQFKDR